MPVTTDIVATYRGPGTVVQRHLAGGESEPRALAFLMAACGVTFIAQWPKLARQAHLEEVDLNPLLGASLMGWLFLAPLFLYGIAFVAHLIARAMGGQGTAFSSRLALFWAFLAASPLMLLEGLVGGFIGPGPALQLVGFLWLVAFGLFWILGMRTAHRGVPA